MEYEIHRYGTSYERLEGVDVRGMSRWYECDSSAGRVKAAKLAIGGKPCILVATWSSPQRWIEIDKTGLAESSAIMLLRASQPSNALKQQRFLGQSRLFTKPGDVI